MASHNNKHSSKRAAQDSEAPGSSSSGPSKRAKQSQTSSKEAKAIATQAKQELRLHQAIERSIQKALKEATVRSLPAQDSSLSHSGTLPNPAAMPSPAETTGAPMVPIPPLSPDGDPSSLTIQGEVHEAFFGPQSEPTPQGFLHSGPQPIFHWW